MNLKKWLLATGAAFLVITVVDYLIHEVWLKSTYLEYLEFWRSHNDMKARMPFLFVGQLVAAGLLALIYPKGFEKKSPTQEGARCGLILGLLVYLPHNLIGYFVYPYPTKLFIDWTLGGVLEYVLAGIMIGMVYGKKPT